MVAVVVVARCGGGGGGALLWWWRAAAKVHGRRRDLPGDESEPSMQLPCIQYSYTFRVN